MKIAIISDVHNNEVNLKKTLNIAKEYSVEKLISCGDLASSEMLDFIVSNFQGEVYHVFGNMDDAHMSELKGRKEYRGVKMFPKKGEIEIGERKLAFTHYPNVARNICQKGKCQIVFYGHTHKPWEEKINSCRMVNPGCVTGDYYPATFAILNTENDDLKLILLDDE
ncbi:hypothetical protein C0584_04445 [Candidatus Parcubacteria bacterium]|nr:MAG: hypothetical protein C0584_04445 [Candidatus Parcubacteria bacterium]